VIPLRGQLSHLSATSASSALRTVVCGRSYISPALHGEHCAGASYSRDVSDMTPTPREDRENLEGIAPHLLQANITDMTLTGARVAVRAGSPDRIPMVGPAVDASALEQLFRTLPQQQRKRPHTALPCYPGVYINVGHGSHGIANSPLLAEYLASLMCGEAVIGDACAGSAASGKIHSAPTQTRTGERVKKTRTAL